MSDDNEKKHNPYISLTEVEVEGLGAKYSFADGHAYHRMPTVLEPVVQNLRDMWEMGRTMTVPDMEEQFKQSVAQIAGSAALANHKYYSIAPTASNSIDIAGAWLDMKGHTVGLLEPVFDNLFLLLNRRKVAMRPIEERDLVDLAGLEAKIEKENLKSLFIVSPNNPTGFHLSQDEFTDLCQLCRRKDVALIIDTTFRFYSKQTFDSYQTLKDTSVDFVVIEDTGKTWPTQDMKASLMVYSESIAKDMRMLYEEVYLCTSNFSLAVLGKLIDETHKAGLDKVVWSEVEKRTARVEQAIANTPLKLIKDEKSCSLPVAWIDCSATGMSDVEMLDKLRPHNVVLLPGRFFYWNSQEQHTDRIRISLMKPDVVFYNGMNVLENALQQIFEPASDASPAMPKTPAQRRTDKKPGLG